MKKPVDVVRDGYNDYRKSGGTNPAAITDLDADVQLTDYDTPGPVIRNGQTAVAGHLMTMWPDVFPNGKDIAPPTFTELSDGKTVVCLNVMQDHVAGTTTPHVCVDYVTVENGKVTNIQCCIARHPIP